MENALSLIEQLSKLQNRLKWEIEYFERSQKICGITGSRTQIEYLEKEINKLSNLETKKLTLYKD